MFCSKVVRAAIMCLSASLTLSFITASPLLAQDANSGRIKGNEKRIVRITSDGKLLAPNGRVMLRTRAPIVLTAPDGKPVARIVKGVVVAKDSGGNCCTAEDQSCCVAKPPKPLPLPVPPKPEAAKPEDGPAKVADMVILIGAKGGLSTSSGQPLMRASGPFRIDLPGGKTIYEHPR